MMESLIPVYFQCSKCDWSFDALDKVHVCNESETKIEDWHMSYCPICGEKTSAGDQFEGKRRDTND